MTPTNTVNLLRTLFVIFMAFLGATIGEVLLHNIGIGIAGALILGLVLVLADRLLKGFTLRAFSSATFGLILGLVFATLIRSSGLFNYLPVDWEWATSLLLYAAFGYFGMMLAIRSNRDEFSLIIPYVRFSREAVQDEPLLIDTNIIIDGRVIEICNTGFLSGSVIIPHFVLDELQKLADSADPLKRERGKRGFDNLNLMEKSPSMDVTIHEGLDFAETEAGVDARILQLSKTTQARLLTNDTNLCKLAKLQRVQALNLNSLANALKPKLTIGDSLELDLVKEGRDPHQAVGYLPDGTMIVVNQGRPLIGSTRSVTVSSTLQTSAGRLIFAELSDLKHPD